MFSDRLKYLRSTEDLTQRDVALKLGIASGAVGMYESGKRFPDNTILNRIADYFNVSTDYLLGRTNDPLPVRNVDQDLIDDQDIESQWHAFISQYSNGTSMFYQYENVSDEQKLLIMQEYLEVLEKKKKKIAKFMDYSLEVIDEALNFAAYNDEQRKKKLDD